MKRIAAVLAFAAVMSVSVAHAQSVDVAIFTNPDAVEDHYVFSVDRAVDTLIARAVTVPFVACDMAGEPGNQCVGVLPGETLVMRGGTLQSVPNAQAGACWTSPDVEARAIASGATRMWCDRP